MTEWSKHVHRFAKKHNMTYKQANVSKKCKEAYKKRKTSPRKKSPRKRRMNPPKIDPETSKYKTVAGKMAKEKGNVNFLNDEMDSIVEEIEEIDDIIDRQDSSKESGRAKIGRYRITRGKYLKALKDLKDDMYTFEAGR